MLQKFLFCFTVLKLSKVEMFFFSETRFFLSGWKEKKQTCQLLMTQTGKAMKKIVLRQEASRIVGTGRFYIKLFMSICTREHSSNPTLVSLFFSWNFTFIVARYCIHIGVLFFFVQHGNKATATNFTEHRSEISLLRILSHKCLKSFDLISLFYYTLPYCYANTAQKIKISIQDFFHKYDQIRSYSRTWSHLLKKSLIEKFIFCTVKASSQAGGRSSKVLRFVNPVVDSDEKDKIFLVFLILLRISGV